MRTAMTFSPARLNRVGDVKAERHHAVLVAADRFAVEIELGRHGGCLRIRGTPSCPRLPAGSVKCLRYQAMPVDRSSMSLRKASSSFQACGRVTGFQCESSKSGFSAPGGSPTKSFQPGLKLYFARGPVCGIAADTDASTNTVMQRIIFLLHT